MVKEKGEIEMPDSQNGHGTTVSFKWERENEAAILAILQNVYRALEEKGYNPVDQLVGYLISGDPAYITSHQQARAQISRVERDEIIEVLLKSYLENFKKE